MKEPTHLYETIIRSEAAIEAATEAMEEAEADLRHKSSHLNFKEYSPEDLRYLQKKAGRARRLNMYAIASLVCLFRMSGMRNKDVAELFDILPNSCSNYWKLRGEISPEGLLNPVRLRSAFSKCNHFIPVEVVSLMKERKIHCSVFGEEHKDAPVNFLPHVGENKQREHASRRAGPAASSFPQPIIEMTISEFLLQWGVIEKEIDSEKNRLKGEIKDVILNGKIKIRNVKL